MAGAARMPVRAAKKAATRRRILDEASRLFEERGYDQVTVADIADAAAVSVKTLFVYFRSKEDLAFADVTLIDDVVHALRNASPEQAKTGVVVDVLRRAAVDDSGGGVAAYRRGYADSVALQSGLARMWNEWEDRVTAVLADLEHRQPSPADRYHAIQLVGLIRVAASEEQLADGGAPTAGQVADVVASLRPLP